MTKLARWLVAGLLLVLLVPVLAGALLLVKLDRWLADG